jgi:putative oxidoreductase
MTTLMLTAPQRDIIREKGTLIGRVLLGLLFFWSGVSILFVQGPSNVAGFYDSVGLPMAGLLVWLVIVLKIVAGGAVMIGKRVGLAAAALIVFTLLTILIAHRDISDINLFKNLAIIGGLLQLMAYGPGGNK